MLNDCTVELSEMGVGKEETWVCAESGIVGR